METDPTIPQAIALATKEIILLIRDNTDIWSVSGVWAAAIATFLASIIALFKEDILSCIKGPKIHIIRFDTFKNKPTHIGGDKTFTDNELQLIVENPKNRHTAKNVRVFIRSIKDPNGNEIKYGPVQLEWVSSFGSVGQDIYAGTSFNLRIARSTYDPNNEREAFVICIERGRVPDKDRVFFDLGNYEANILLVADNAKRTEKKIKIDATNFQDLKACFL